MRICKFKSGDGRTHFTHAYCYGYKDHQYEMPEFLVITSSCRIAEVSGRIRSAEHFS